jgi:hypothetical protein
MPSLDLGHGLVRMGGIGNQSPVGAVGQQIQFFQDGLADEDFIAQDQGFFHGVSLVDFENDRLGDVYSFPSPIRVFSDTLAAYRQSQLLPYLNGDYRANGAGIDKRVRFDAHLADCEGCEAYLDQMRETIRLTGSLSDVSLPRRICDELLEAFGRRRPG